MKILLYVLPIALLVAYSQIAIKLRVISAGNIDVENLTLFARILKYVSDPIMWSAYVAALLASFVWLYVITKLPLVVAFPIYIGVTFFLVVVGGWYFLAESITFVRLLSVFLILTGIIIGVKN